MPAISRSVRVLAFVCGSAALGAAAIAADADQDKDRGKNLIAGYEETKELLRLMDKDKNGKVSKKEFMSFMEAEFDRLDADKSGELDIEELSKIKVTRHPGGTGGR